jgi:hypothetical protein
MDDASPTKLVDHGVIYVRLIKYDKSADRKNEVFITKIMS